MFWFSINTVTSFACTICKMIRWDPSKLSCWTLCVAILREKTPRRFVPMWPGSPRCIIWKRPSALTLKGWFDKELFFSDGTFFCRGWRSWKISYIHHCWTTWFNWYFTYSCLNCSAFQGWVHIFKILIYWISDGCVWPFQVETCCN